MPDTQPLSFDEFLIRMREPLTFLRYGDGDWIALLDPMQGASILNCRRADPDVAALVADARSLLRAVRGPLYGMQPLANGMGIRPAIDAWVAANCPDVVWYNADVLHEANEAGGTRRFVEALKDVNAVLLGPEYLDPLVNKVKFAARVTIPHAKGFTKRAEICDTLLDLQERLGAITVCATSFLASKVIGQTLYPAFAGRSSFIDCGTMWDPHVGIKSRRYHHRMKSRDLL